MELPLVLIVNPSCLNIPSFPAMICGATTVYLVSMPVSYFQRKCQQIVYLKMSRTIYFVAGACFSRELSMQFRISFPFSISLSSSTESSSTSNLSAWEIGIILKLPSAAG